MILQCPYGSIVGAFSEYRSGRKSASLAVLLERVLFYRSTELTREARESGIFVPSSSSSSH